MNKVIEVMMEYFIKNKVYTIYYVITTIYLFFLNNLNKELEGLESDPFNVLTYNNGEPVIYFLIASILFVVGIVLFIKNLENSNYYHGYDEDLNLIHTVINIILIGVCIVLIFFFIDNPILRSVLTVLLIGIPFAFSSNK